MLTGRGGTEKRPTKTQYCDNWGNGKGTTYQEGRHQLYSADLTNLARLQALLESREREPAVNPVFASIDAEVWFVSQSGHK